MAGNLFDLTDDNFDVEVLKSDIPVLVDFWAEWCGPCKQLAPIIEELEKEYAGRIKFCKLNIDLFQINPARYNITAIPTIIVFKNGNAAQKMVGVKAKKEYKSVIDNQLK
ncbi:MAG TPA: thioredoxin [Candidatus Brocadiia bacterium]|nr:thioredoxin [Planctomycetota bacterium]MBI4007078.1 thioredoxin [Planctomycetota bacterium]MDO8092373.1 thioredoxin [Candidatus Brocadiales bacterium]